MIEVHVDGVPMLMNEMMIYSVMPVNPDPVGSRAKIIFGTTDQIIVDETYETVKRKVDKEYDTIKRMTEDCVDWAEDDFN